MTGHAVTWTSADPTRATITSSATLTGVAIGTTTVVAATDSASASIVVPILTRPTADWSRAADWVTGRANARRSGYVDATLDPGAFRVAWERTVAPYSMGGLTAAVGHIFVPVNAGSFEQRLYAFSGADGSPRWVRDFAEFGGINQPTYDGGLLYMTSSGGANTFLWVLDATDGSVRLKAPFVDQLGATGAPAVSGQTVLTIGGNFGGLLGFDKASGAQRFFFPLWQFASGSPTVAEDGIVFVPSADRGNGITAVDPVSGSLLYEVADTRLFPGGTLIVGGANNVIMGTTSFDRASRQVAWDFDVPVLTNPVVGNGVLYVFTGKSVQAHRETDGQLPAAVELGSAGVVREFAVNDGPYQQHLVLRTLGNWRTGPHIRSRRPDPPGCMDVSRHRPAGDQQGWVALHRRQPGEARCDRAEITAFDPALPRGCRRASRPTCFPGSATASDSRAMHRERVAALHVAGGRACDVVFERRYNLSR